MQRVCFQLKVKPHLVSSYIKAHATVWPEMLQAIVDSNRQNYSLFLNEDGLLVGYYETESVEASQAALEADPRTAAWEARMTGYFLSLNGRPDQNAIVLQQVFNLEEQLQADGS
ncbi:L-rhamnose mutarotase [Microbacterium sp.]|uniref:L-rhamnose mutarotase n=1 Tax=Microbacterium sp. TaxID=51671 RepID=UPI003F711B6A